MRKLALSLCISISLLIPLSYVQAAAPLADRVPADYATYFGWAGKSAAFDSSLAGQMVNEPGFKEVVAAARAALLKFTGEKEPQVQLVLNHVMDMAGVAWQHPMAVGGSIPVMSLAGAATQPWDKGLPNMVLLIDLGADREKFDAHLQAILAIAQSKGTFSIKEATAGSVKYQVMQSEPEAPVISLGYMGNVFFFAFGTADSAGKIIALAGAPEKSLAKDPGFLAGYKDVTGENELTVSYLKAAPILDTFRQALRNNPAEQAKFNMFINASGLNKITAMVSSTRIVDKGMYTKTRILSPAPHQGVLMLLAGEPMSAADLAIAPGDTDFLLAFKMNPTQVLAEVRRIAGEIDPRAAAEMDRGLMMASTMLKMSIENDLLANLGDQWTLVSAPSLGGSLTGTALIVQVKDAQKLSAAVAKLEDAARARMSRTQMSGEDSASQSAGRVAASSIRSYMAGKTKISYLTPSREMPVLAPAWAVQNDKLIIAAWPQVVEAVLQGTGTGTLDKDAAFKTAFQHISGKPSIVAYANWPKLVRQYYGLPMVGWTAAAAGLGRQGISIRPEWLPSLPMVAKYVWPSVSGVSADDKGITCESYGNGSLGLTSIAMAPTSIAMLLPALGRARESAREAVSMSNTRAIGMGVIMWQADHKDVPPETLEQLIRAGLVAEKALISPLSGTKAYVYIPPADNKWDTIMIYEDPATHGRAKTAAAYADGHGEMVPVDQKFRDQVKRAQENSQKAFGKDGKAGNAGKDEGF